MARGGSLYQAPIPSNDSHPLLSLSLFPSSIFQLRSVDALQSHFPLLHLTKNLQGMYDFSRLSVYSNVQFYTSALVRDRANRHLSPSSSNHHICTKFTTLSGFPRRGYRFGFSRYHSCPEDDTIFEQNT